jgi:hypothetical protein
MEHMCACARTHTHKHVKSVYLTDIFLIIILNSHKNHVEQSFQMQSVSFCR